MFDWLMGHILFFTPLVLIQEKPLLPPNFPSMTIFVAIKVHFQGVFINMHFCYSDDISHMFKNIDFAGIL
ncbi:unnamed protein product [Lactuca virosa]|uniref:Uncharacterized protein n=1 Tax=Lactuca virosa TaxID=75947 RepID=A0AAU9N228_9ASTR|nr:unnamed protein product [Lactuca virosa]